MINNEILLMRDDLVKDLQPEQIFLFGSFAKDTFHEESDYDFCIIISDNIKKDINLKVKALDSILKPYKTRPVDLFIRNKTDFYERAQFETFEKEILETGIKIYDCSEIS